MGANKFEHSPAEEPPLPSRVSRLPAMLKLLMLSLLVVFAGF